jgi:Fe-S-cluster containining protein
MSEELVAVAQTNAMAAYARLEPAIPKSLVQKEARLVEWYSRLKGNPQTKLLALYDFMADLYGAVSSFTPCKKGCTSCCHIPVSVCDVEIEVIERRAGVRRKKRLGEPDKYHGQPCPFLMNKVCSIYAYRPFVCRRHVTLTKTSHWCHPDRSNEAEFQMLRFSEVDRVFDAIRLESGSTQPVDIRQVFG